MSRTLRSSSPGRSAFTLIEMLVACVVTALVMASVLMLLANVGRDRAILDAAAAMPRHDALVERVRWDLTNASTITELRDGSGVLIYGNNGLDPRTMIANGRLARVTYRVAPMGRGTVLLREQELVDAAFEGKRDKRVEVAAMNVTGFSLTSATSDAEPVVPGDSLVIYQPKDARAAAEIPYLLRTTTIPRRIRLLMRFPEGTLNEELSIR